MQLISLLWYPLPHTVSFEQDFDELVEQEKQALLEEAQALKEQEEAAQQKT